MPTIYFGMAVSRLDSSGSGLRAVNAAMAIGKIVRVDSIFSRLGTISHNDEMAPSMLERVINADPVLGQRVLVAIAVYCSEMKKPIPGSIGDAARDLSYGLVRKIVLTVGLDAVHKEMQSRTQLQAKQLTDQAIAVATASEYFGLKVGQAESTGFAAGLFANVGVWTLANAERAYGGICTSVAGGTIQLHEAEQLALTCTHAEAGYCLLTEYAFPEQVCMVAANHTHPSSSSMVMALYLAETFAHQLGYDGGFAIVPPQFDEDSLKKFGATSADTERLLGAITQWNSLASKFLA